VELEILDFLKGASPLSFEELALKIYGYQRRANSVYDHFCHYSGIGLDMDSWKQIPAVPQQAFKKSALRSFPAEAASVEFRTSGTTGEGYGSHYFPSLTLYKSAVQSGWDHFKLPRHRFLLLMQDPKVAPHSSLARMGQFLVSSQKQEQTSNPFFVSETGNLEIERLAQHIQDLETPIVLFGTALAFLNLFEQSEHRRLTLPPDSIVMETGGFKGSGREIDKEELYNQFADFFGLPLHSIWNEYGMTELSSQFYTYGIGRPHQAPPWMRVLLINPVTNEEVKPGETGMVRIFDLANLWSVQAIQTQDLAIAQPDGSFLLVGRDPNALPRGCSRAMDELISK
jgi:hypothetical protein